MEPRAEDVAFGEWKENPNLRTERTLIELLNRHAFAVCWLKLQEHPKGLVNECVFAALRGAEGFRGDSSFSTWYQALVQNKCNRYLQLKVLHREREVSLSEPMSMLEDVTVGDVLEAPEVDPTSKIAIEQLMGRLQEDERELVRRHLRGETGAEITSGMGLASPEAERQWWKRVRTKMLEMLGG